MKTKRSTAARYDIGRQLHALDPGGPVEPFVAVAAHILTAVGDIPDDWPVPTQWNFTAGQLRRFVAAFRRDGNT